MEGIPTVETERLLLRGWREDYLDAYTALMSDVEVTSYVGGASSRSDAWRGIAGMIGHWALRGFGLWAMERKLDGAFIGRAGLYCPADWPGLEVTWTVARPHWGQGYATEAAKASVRFGFKKTSASKLISLIHPGNYRSERVAEKIGETRVGRTSIVIFGKASDVDVWETTRESQQSN